MHFSRIRINNFYNLKDVDLDLSSGSALIVGANGSGKTNIIKCVHKLVKVITSNSTQSGKFFDRGIWNVDKSSNGKPYIKIEAFLNKDEAQLLSSLQAVLITYFVAELATQISGFLCRELRNTQEQFESEFKATILERCVNKLYQGLVELDLKSNEQQDNVPSTLGVHFYAEHLERETFRLDASFTNDVKFFGDTDAKTKLVKDVLNSLLHDSDVENFDFKFSLYDKTVSLKNCIRRLVDPFILQLQESNSYRIDSRLGVVWKNHYSHYGDVLEDEEKYPEFFEALQILLERLTKKSGGQYSTWRDLKQFPVNDGLYNTIRGFLKESICILPQDRRTEDEADQWILTLKEVERQLITWNLSESIIRRNQFAKVKEKFRTLSGLDITAVEKNKENLLVKDHLEKTVSSCSELIQKQDAYEIAVKLKSCSDELLKVMPSGCRYMELIATKIVGEGSAKECVGLLPMSEWSGGERECLMILTATQMSTADTLFLDEPGHSLHPPQQAQLRRFLENKTRQTIATITHATEFISATSLRSLYHMSATDLYFTPLKLTVEEEIYFHNDDDDQDGGDGDDDDDGGDDDGDGVDDDGDDVGDEGGDGDADRDRDSDDGDGNDDDDDASDGDDGGDGDDDRDSDGDDDDDASDCDDDGDSSTNRVLFKPKDLNLLIEPHLCKIFFSTGLYFVEGQSDKKILSLLRRHMLKQAEKIREKTDDVSELLDAVNTLQMDNWDVLSLGGCSLAVKAYKAAKDLKIPCAFVLDEDSITVKCGSIVQPITKDNWEKSALFRDLKAVASSFSEATDLLAEMQMAFESSTPDEMPVKVRERLQKYGFWIWNGDLEGVIFDNNDVREKVKKMGEFVKLVLPSEKERQLISGRSALSQKVALDNFEERINEPLEELMEQLQKELSASREATINAGDSTLPVTEKLQQVLKKLGKFQQKAADHDRFCRKGTTRSVEDDETAVEVSTNDNAFWKRIKKQLHDHGVWMKIPEKMILDIIEVCLQSGNGDDHQLAQFCKFMKTHQSIGKRNKDLPKDIANRIITMHLGHN